MVLKERAGFLTANTGLYARLTPRETLTYFARLRGVSESVLKAHVDGLITLLDLTRFADRRCEGMSTGERQRLALIRALVRQPAVLLLDEPTASLDSDSVAAVEMLLRERREGGMALLVVTHDLAQAERLGDRHQRLVKGLFAA